MAKNNVIIETYYFGQGRTAALGATLDSSMERTFVIGDIHGAYRALRQCLEKAQFDFSSDHLVCLGDVADGWPDTKASIDELLRIKNLIYVLGNHDWWTLRWMVSGTIEDIWYEQGGRATVQSYSGGVPKDHITMLSNACEYHLLGNRLFVHAGIDPLMPLKKQNQNIFLWDRTLASSVLDLYRRGEERKLTAFDEIYIGHTPIPYPHPINASGVWMMDTGAGWSGVLSMVDIHTKEMFISDPVPDLYPGVEGRKRWRQ